MLRRIVEGAFIRRLGLVGRHSCDRYYGQSIVPGGSKVRAGLEKTAPRVSTVQEDESGAFWIQQSFSLWRWKPNRATSRSGGGDVRAAGRCTERGSWTCAAVPRQNSMGRARVGETESCHVKDCVG